VLVSVVIPVYNEERHIARCLESIAASRFPKDDFEVILVDGMSSDATRSIIARYTQKYPFIRLLDNPARITPAAMNLGIRAARGEYVFILSAHAKYPKDYFTALVEAAKRLGAECVGPRLITCVRSHTPAAYAIKNVLEDRLGVGSAFRVGGAKEREVDTVAFGCYKKEIFDRVGLFDERLVRNQDIELNRRIRRAGGKIFLVPSVKAFYYARDRLWDFAANSFQNGRWNILTAYYTGTLGSLSLRHYIPLLFVLSLLFFAVLEAVVSKKFLYLFVLELGLYLAVVAVRSLRIKRRTTFFHQLAAFLVLHISYGLGSLYGLLEVAKRIIRGKK